MGVVFRQSVKNIIVVAAGALLGIFTLWLSLRYTTHQQLGFLRTITNYAVVFSLMLLGGLNSTMSTYIHKYDNNDPKRKLLISLCFAFPFLFLLLLTGVYFLFPDQVIQNFKKEDIPYIRQYYNWLPAFTLFFIYMTLFEQYLSSQMKVAVSAFMREVVLRIVNIIIILLFGIGYLSFSGLVEGSILIYLIPLGIFLLLAFKTRGFGLSFQLSSFSRKEYKDLANFSWYHFLLSFTILLLGYLDALLLPIYGPEGMSSLAVYSVAIVLISFFQLPYKAMMPATFTILAKAFAENDLPKAKDLFIRSSNNIFLVTVVVGILICCNLYNAVSVIRNGYSEIIPVFLILFIGNLANIATGMNDQVLSIAKYYKFNFILSLAVLIILYTMIRILVPEYGMYGAAWSTTTILILFNIIKCWFVWKKLDMQPFSINTLKILICALPALAVGYFFPYFFNPDRHVYVHTFLDVIMRSSVIVVVYMLMLIWLKPSKDLEEYLATVKKDKRLF